MARSLGRVEAGLLEAALEGADAKRTLERALAEPTAQLVEQAYAVCLEAHAAFQKYSAPQRAQLRGFSLQLLALATEQSLLLERALGEYERKVKEQEEARTRVRELFERNLKLSAQARMVLEKVNGDDAVVQKELREPEASASSYALSESLKRLSDVGGNLIRSGAPTVRGRARLYGLDEHFLNGLAVAGQELLSFEQKAGDQSAITMRKNQLDRTQAATYVLIRQIGEAFAAAAGVDPRITALASAQPKPEPEAKGVKKAAAKPAPVTIVNSGAPPAAPKVIGPAPALRVIDPSELDRGKTMRS